MKMKLILSDICVFGQCTFTSRNFIEGEKLVNAKHIIYCGKDNEENDPADHYDLTAYVLQTSSMRERPHEICGIIKKTGQIQSMSCSCKAGLSGRCKHVLGVLLHLSRTDIADIPVLPCTDKKCIWKKEQKETLQHYDPVPLVEHPCFKELARKKSFSFNTDIGLEDIREK